MIKPQRADSRNAARLSTEHSEENLKLKEVEVLQRGACFTGVGWHGIRVLGILSGTPNLAKSQARHGRGESPTFFLAVPQIAPILPLFPKTPPRVIKPKESQR